jgi:NADH dehydrogenase
MINIPESDKKRIVIIGAGFAGLKLARKLKNSGYQVVIVDRFNFHQFQPLFYQVATSGLEPGSISFPLRKIFQHYRDFYIRLATVNHIDADAQQIWTDFGVLHYDYLVLAYGAGNFFFGMKNLEEKANPMKSIPEALTLRNSILKNFEKALSFRTDEERAVYLNIVVAGGGPSGVEISGALAEMIRNVIPKDFPELQQSKIRIHLVETTGKLLSTMSEKSSLKAKEFLEKLGVIVNLNTAVSDYDGTTVRLSDQSVIPANVVIWTAGIKVRRIDGLRDKTYSGNGRIIVDRFNKVAGYDRIFAVGDAALMKEDKYPMGHPQVAPAAQQQAAWLAKNLGIMRDGKEMKPFTYKDKGTMATIGRNLAVVDLPYAHFHGTFAWFVWMFVHLMSIVGTRNRIIIFLDWFWNYITYDQSLRLILTPKDCPQD